MLASKQLTLRPVGVVGEIAKTSQPAATATVSWSQAPKDRRKLIFAIVSIGLFMASVDQPNVMVSQHVVAGQGSATGS
jgi:hypothetical protein